MSKKKEVTVSFNGCVVFIVSVFILWALIFGITIDKKHYGLSCSTDKGVEVDK